MNELIKNVKKEEVRKRGKATVARRQLELAEFENLLSIQHKDRDPLKKFGYSCLVILQLHF